MIDQLILETDQPDRAEILEGAYHLLTNADVIHGEEELTGNWYFDVHGVAYRKMIDCFPFN